MNFLSVVTDFGDRVTFYVRSCVRMESDVQVVCMLYVCMHVCVCNVIMS